MNDREYEKKSNELEKELKPFLTDENNDSLTLTGADK